MNASQRLQTLAAREPAVAPYGYDDFELRGQRARGRRFATQRGLAASLAIVGVAVVLAITTRRPGTEVAVDSTALAPPPAQSAQDAVREEPALVDLGQFAMRSELEDRIAWVDMQLSVGRAYAAPADQLQELAATRDRLEQSLQRVSYAQSLMSL